MQRSLRSAKSELGTENYEYISIVVDINVSDADIVAFADGQGFDWVFTVASPEFLNAFINQYGRSVITSPNMVHFVIRPDGTQSQFFQGASQPATLIQEILSVDDQ